jgi:heme-degrading monooxygenase HmoA
MVLEHALLDVISGLEVEFEEAFSRAREIISKSPGFISLKIVRGIERPSSYLLLVEWETLEDHTIGFRQSARYAEWREILHHFYDPFPVVEHFVEIQSQIQSRLKH